MQVRSKLRVRSIYNTIKSVLHRVHVIKNLIRKYGNNQHVDISHQIQCVKLKE